MAVKKELISKVLYLARDELYKTEKPYLVTPGVPILDIEDAKETNRIAEEREIMLTDVRDCKDFGLDLTGWTFVKAATRIRPEEFDNYSTVETKYYDELEQVVKSHFPQYTKLAFLDHVVRKRSSKFPLQVGERVGAEQPLSLVHSDFSALGAQRRVEKYIELDPDLAKRPFDMLNIWRLIRKGPNNDWPLGLCDWRTIDSDKDPIDNDVIFNEGATENTALHYDPGHRWYWMSNMDADDLIVLRNTSSQGRDAARAFHAAFEVLSPDFLRGELRESIEVRMVAFL